MIFQLVLGVLAHQYFLVALVFFSLLNTYNVLYSTMVSNSPTFE